MSPRAGGDSLLGAYEFEPYEEYDVVSKGNAHFDEDISRRPSAFTNEDYNMKGDASADDVSNLDRSMHARTEIFAEKESARRGDVSVHDDLHEEQVHIESKLSAGKGTISDKSMEHQIEQLGAVTPVNDDVTNPPTAFGNEQAYIEPTDPAAGPATGIQTHRSDNT